MANHVTTRFELQEGNEEAKAYFKELADKCTQIRDEYIAARELAKVKGESYEGVTDVNCWALFQDTTDMVMEKDWSSLIGRIGSKWAYVDDWYDDSLTIISAWSVPEDFINRIVEEVNEIDPMAIMSTTYDDEAPNFIGCAVYAEGEQWDSFELDESEYAQFGLAFYWDEDENDGEEEPDDFEPTYEEAWNLLDDEVSSMVESFKEYVRDRDEELVEEQQRYSGEL